MNLLLVGGPADGRRCNVRPGMRWFQVARLPTSRATRLDYMHPESTAVALTENYELWPVHERSGESMYVGLHESLNPDNLLAHLVAGYRHEVQP